MNLRRMEHNKDSKAKPESPEPTKAVMLTKVQLEVMMKARMAARATVGTVSPPKVERSMSSEERRNSNSYDASIRRILRYP